MFHSVLIPHRDRYDNLELCVWSLLRSAQACGEHSFELVVSDSGSTAPVPEWIRAVRSLRFIEDPDPPEQFNKPRALNRGLDACRGRFISALDADAIVAPRWFNGAWILNDDPAVTRVAYRVRYIPATVATALQEQADSGRESTLGDLFARYNDRKPNGEPLYSCRYEAYGQHDRNGHDGRQPAWGNSQFTMRRADIGDLRWDEGYSGHGMEDLDFNMQVAAKFGDQFCGRIQTDGDTAMFHLEHAYGEGWRNRKTTQANMARYREKRMRLLGR